MYFHFFYIFHSDILDLCVSTIWGYW